MLLPKLVTQYKTGQIEVTIKNQPFASYTDSNGSYISLYYNVGSKGHYRTDWSYYPNSGKTYLASNSDFTVITFNIDGLCAYGETLGVIPSGSKIDFQVEALIGSYTDTVVSIYPGHALHQLRMLRCLVVKQVTGATPNHNYT